MLYLIMDLEATCWEYRAGRQNEIIEIGAVMVDHTMNSVGEFDTFVQPVLNPVLSQYCTDLTSIQQKDVDSAPQFKAAHESFIQWVQSFAERDIVFMSWGDYDKRQYFQDCMLHAVTYPFKLHVNIKKLYSSITNTQKSSVWEALQRLHFSFDGTPHRGIDDCRNILKICRYLHEKSTFQLWIDRVADEHTPVLERREQCD